LVKITPIDPNADPNGPDAFKRWTGGEPSIATGPEGNLYMSAPGSGMLFARSIDDGATWTVPANRANPASGDTSVNVDSSGAVYQTDLSGNNGANTLQADV